MLTMTDGRKANWTMRAALAALVLTSGTGAIAPVTAGASAAMLSEDLTVPQRVAQLRAQEMRMLVIGERLAVAAAPWCEPNRSMGWLLADLGQYPKHVRQAVRGEWQVPTGAALFISAVAPGSAAASAGLTAGMAITSINGESPMRYNGESASRHALARNETTLDEAINGTEPAVIETLSQDGTRRTVTLTGRRACPSRFEMAAQEEEQAWADGSIVQVTIGMAIYAAQDVELASVVAHELAHNMLRHRLRSDARGIPVNYTRFLTANARVVRGMEEEADRLSVWLLAQAGYDAAAPVAFWNRFGPGHDTPHPFGRLHDRWEQRVRHVQDELIQLRTAGRRPSPARPPLLVRAIAEYDAALAAEQAGQATRTESDDERSSAPERSDTAAPADGAAPNFW